MAYNISDEKLIEKINGLSDADEALFKVALEGVLLVTPTEMSFTKAADSTGKSVTATSSGSVSAVSDQSWATVSVSGSVVTVTVAANAGASRKAAVTVSADGKKAVVAVTQEGV